MTKIYEALEHAKQNKNQPGSPDDPKGKKSSRQFGKSGAREQSAHSYQSEVEGSLTTLYQNITVLLPQRPCRIIQFISARPDEGTSLLTREFAKLCAFKFHKSVLLVDIAPKRYSQMASFNLAVESGWGNLARQGLPLNSSISQVSQSGLYVTSIIGNDDSSPLEADSEEINKCFESLAEEFDYILVDFSPTSTYSDSTIMSRNIDGVILIVEAEKTRWQVAQKLKDKLTAQRANLLGVLLNKRTFPIPDYIYKYL